MASVTKNLLILKFCSATWVLRRYVKMSILTLFNRNFDSNCIYGIEWKKFVDWQIVWNRCTFVALIAAFDIMQIANVIRAGRRKWTAKQHWKFVVFVNKTDIRILSLSVWASLYLFLVKAMDCSTFCYPWKSLKQGPYVLWQVECSEKRCFFNSDCVSYSFFLYTYLATFNKINIERERMKWKASIAVFGV